MSDLRLCIAVASCLLVHCLKGVTLMAGAKMLVTGTPGIGKTSWIIYLLWKLANAGKTVILDLDKDVFFFSRQAYNSQASVASSAIRTPITHSCH